MTSVGAAISISTNPAYANERASEVDPNTGEYIRDYLKVDSRSHAGGSLEFGPDGALYVSVGDGTSFNYADPHSVSVQDLDSLSGKILRVDPETGRGFTDNPFWEQGLSLDSNQAKVYQLGLRNPFAMAFDENGQLFIGNTGWNSWEAVFTGQAGANFGWPFYEGGDNGVLLTTPVYRDFSGGDRVLQRCCTRHGERRYHRRVPRVRSFGLSARLPGSRACRSR